MLSASEKYSQLTDKYIILPSNTDQNQKNEAVGSLNSGGVWHFACDNFLGSVLILPLITDAADIKDALDDLMEMCNEAVWDVCISESDGGLTQDELRNMMETDMAGYNHVAGHVYEALMIESVVSIAKSVGMEAMITGSGEYGEGVRDGDRAIKLSNLSLIENSSLFAALCVVFSKSDGLVIESESRKIFNTGAYISVGR